MQEFVNANPSLKPDMIAVVCGGPGNRLKEVRICVTREGVFRACGANENPRRLCQSPRLTVPPLRAAAGSAPQGRGWFSPPGAPAPGPAEIGRGERKI